MLRRLSLSRKVWVLLLILLLLGGAAWADTFDLSDDIPLASGADEQTIILSEDIQEEVRAFLLSTILTWFWTGCVLAAPVERLVCDASEPIGFGPPVYQRLSIYRI